ncbi:MAG: ATP-dependent zinc protease [Planctomycetaceae bacterium]|nr:ATP-dependent zinc protease [Planctomycetaceae bacterium]
MSNSRELPLIGWREWVALPQLEIPRIKAKIDTGARSSSIHAHNLRRFHYRSREYVTFDIHPVQRKRTPAVEVTLPVLEDRSVRSSNGKASIRPVVLTEIELMGSRWEIELTLANRDSMGFRMLLGREAFRHRFLVDVSGSYYGEKFRKKQENKRRKHS